MMKLHFSTPDKEPIIYRMDSGDCLRGLIATPGAFHILRRFDGDFDLYLTEPVRIEDAPPKAKPE